MHFYKKQKKKGKKKIMKHVKKFVSLLLALVMVMGLTVTVSAAQGTNDNSGKITIDNAVVGQTYTIYQILTLESYDTDKGAYSYKVADGWSGFINGSDIKNTYVKVDGEEGYVTWVEGADAAAFAKLAQAYAKTNNVVNKGTTEATDTTVEFADLNLGYYLVDSTLGTLCSLDTTEPEVTIKEKNAAPENEKTVEEDSTESYGKTNDADLGQTINFKSTITAQAGAENYVFHDRMSCRVDLC